MKYIQLLIYFLLILHTAEANDFYVTDSSQWVYCFRDSLGSPFYDYTVYKYLKDTVVQSNICKYIECDDNIDNVVLYENDQKVFYYQDEVFKLLYDFSVQENDTVYLDIRAVSFRVLGEQIFMIDTTLSVKSIVSKVDSIQVSDTIYLQRVTVNIYPEADFLVNSTWPETISYIEKLGYLSDGFLPIIIKGFSIAINHDRDLRCYSEEDYCYITDFWKQLSSDCYYKTKTSIAENVICGIGLYPNPFGDIVNISVNDEKAVADGVLVELFDYTGKLVLNSFFHCSNNFQLSLSHLQKGL
ncbi:MAG: T9SS type A sorting domain-containing protein, partial [Bacteroidales bacterium]|nr:T9SS type A sorting domain-containing protein [Bacteroidales bacterium]